MKTLFVFMLVCLALTPTLATVARAADRQACNVAVDITDTDPKGTNVRSTPGGAVITSLKNPTSDGWIAVHITAQLGDWFEIDRANLIDANSSPDDKVIFRGKGYLHKSVLGVSGLQNGAAIYTDHDIKSSPIELHAAGDQQVDLLGCWGEFLKVHVKKGIGWTKEACTNMNTTCS
ncbi:MAG TPA: hypothetical protein VGM57_06585 [Pseudolabrys sp.]